MEFPALNKKLNQQQIDYVLYHFAQTFTLTDQIRKKIVFDRNDLENTNAILFNLTDKELDLSTIIDRDGVPVLFPENTASSAYYFENENLIFTDDLLKSAFYLLSGYQEYNSPYKDFLGRFPYEKSIQKQLGIIQKPIVNYYFEIIFQGIKKFCEVHNLTIHRKKVFENFGFFLTHDIDVVDMYNFPDFVFKIKQLLGLKQNVYPYKTILKSNIKYILRYMNPLSSENPFWNFDYLDSIENKYSLKAGYFFLQKGDVGDAYFDLTEKRIININRELSKKGHEVGLHGTQLSATNINRLKGDLNRLTSITNSKIYGGRQHRLTFNLPLTLQLHERAGLKYDSTLGFAAHEGFRNSYCLPFKLYDFEADRMINLWEFPLNVMDATLFFYRKLTMEDAYQQVMQIIDEIEKFNGLFTLLWHNSFFDEDLLPGIKKLYENILENTIARKAEGVLGRQIVEQLSNVR